MGGNKSCRSSVKCAWGGFTILLPGFICLIHYDWTWPLWLHLRSRTMALQSRPVPKYPVWFCQPSFPMRWIRIPCQTHPTRPSAVTACRWILLLPRERLAISCRLSYLSQRWGMLGRSRWGWWSFFHVSQLQPSYALNHIFLKGKDNLVESHWFWSIDVFSIDFYQ